jgi:hypothetical protein
LQIRRASVCRQKAALGAHSLPMDFDDSRCREMLFPIRAQSRRIGSTCVRVEKTGNPV